MRTVHCSGYFRGGVCRWSGCLPRGGCLPRLGVCPEGLSAWGWWSICLQGFAEGCTPPPWTDSLTDRCKNITFLQLRLWTVIITRLFLGALEHENVRVQVSMRTSYQCFTTPVSLDEWLKLECVSLFQSRYIREHRGQSSCYLAWAKGHWGVLRYFKSMKKSTCNIKSVKGIEEWYE